MMANDDGGGGWCLCDVGARWPLIIMMHTRKHAHRAKTTASQTCDQGISNDSASKIAQTIAQRLNMPPKFPPEIRPNDRVIGATASSVSLPHFLLQALCAAAVLTFP